MAINWGKKNIPWFKAISLKTIDDACQPGLANAMNKLEGGLANLESNGLSKVFYLLTVYCIYLSTPVHVLTMYLLLLSR